MLCAVMIVEPGVTLQRSDGRGRTTLSSSSLISSKIDEVSEAADVLCDSVTGGALRIVQMLIRNLGARTLGETETDIYIYITVDRTRESARICKPRSTPQQE